MQQSKIISSIATILSSVKQYFSKNGFVGGIIFGAIFGLIVNMATVQLQDDIQGQRVLEAVENEVVSHLLQARSLIIDNDKKIEEYEELLLFNYFTPYSDRVWSTSEGVKYISRLNPTLQGELSLYYRIIVQGNNNLIGVYGDYISGEILGCEYKVAIEYEACKSLQKQQLRGEILSAEQIIKNSTKLLEDFHPTQDRLNSWLLKLFIGKDAPAIFKTD